MVTCYLAGPRGGSGVHEWRAEFTSYVDSYVDCINPFTVTTDETPGLQKYQVDTALLQRADVLLLYRTLNAEVCGGYVEAGLAGEVGDGTPVVVWNGAETPVPDFLEWHASAVADTCRDAYDSVLRWHTLPRIED